MVPFKILRGDSTRIDLDSTPFHDGYAYLTPDDGGFYIDTFVGDEGKRIRINPPAGGNASNFVNITLSANAWSDNKQTVSVGGLGAEQNGAIGLAQNITEEQLMEANEAMLYVCGQSEGSLTIAAKGEIPKCDIPATVILLV